MEDTILIVGAGQAGGRAAEALRRGCFKGRIVMVGDETHRPYERPPLSKDVLLAKDDTTCFSGWLHDASFYDDSAVEHLNDSVAKLDTQRHIAILASGSELTYDKCLIATGGRARDIEGIERSARVVSLRTLDDALRLRTLLIGAKHVAVIGGGFLGLEFAASARARGIDVTVFEAGSRLLARAIPNAFAEKLLEKHESQGVRVIFDAGATSVRTHDDAVIVMNRTGTSQFDFCVIAVGQMPNDEIAHQSGIAVDNGIVVDEFCRTSAPNVYAAGDCANFSLNANGRRMRLESWQNAQEQAIAAAKNMLGVETPYRPMPWFWTDQYDWNIQMLGLHDDSIDRWVLRAGADEKMLLIGLRENVVVFALALNQGGDLRALRRVIEQAKPVDADRLADPNVKLRQII
ncbi:MAG: Ferredoxin reductase [uncultured Paraburkholderia sp.]|nr:MAG: Ferredoxin reductase [uncultured Paraburkholderia sp.]